MAQIYKRNNSWAFRISYSDSTGERHTINRQGFKKKSDAINEARVVEVKKNQVGIFRQNETISLADYFKNWIETYKIGRWYKNTEGKYLAAEKFIRKHFKNTPLKKIKKSDYQKMLDKYAETHVKDSVSLLNSYIRTSIKDALEQQIIYFDFTRNIQIQSKKVSDKKIKYFEIDEADEIRKECLETASMRYITKYEIALAIATGMRYGEVTGLTWKDIDFETNKIDINKTYDYHHRTGFKKTKTVSSNRIIDVDPITMNMLKRLKHEQAELFLKQGYRDDIGLVFNNYAHMVPTDNGANKALKKIQQELKIKKDHELTFHSLRHTHASILIANDVSLEYVAARLGHADTSITSKVYVHLLKDKQATEAKKTVTIFG